MSYPMNIGPYLAQAAGENWNVNVGVDCQDLYDPGAPYWEDSQKTYTFVADEDVEVDISCIGSPTPSFQWYKNGVAQASQKNRILYISNSSAVDGGQWFCRATNAVGFSDSIHFQLEIQTNIYTRDWSGNIGPYQNKTAGETSYYINIGPCPANQAFPPTVVISGDTTALSGGSFTLSVVVSGTGPFTYKWFKKDVGEIFGQTTETLTYIASEDLGTQYYYCEVVGPGGSTTSDYWGILSVAQGYTKNMFDLPINLGRE
jgi:hypothetical protein